MLKRAQSRKKNEIHQTASSVPLTPAKSNKSWVWWVVGSVVLLTLVFWSDISDTFSSTNTWIPTTQSSKDYSYSCIGSDGFSYTRPKNAFCDNRKTPQWRSCESWYKSVKWYWDVGRYCECNTKYYSCSDYHNTITKPMKDQYNSIINYLAWAQVNRYSQSSVNYYNNQLIKAQELESRINRYISENCECK